MNIIWHSAPAYFKTGYGVQTQGFVPQIQALGHNIQVVNCLDVQDMPGMVWQGIPHLPGGPAQWGIEGVMQWIQRMPIDLVITLFDVWPFPEDFGHNIQAQGADWMPIVPIDCEPVHEYALKVLNGASYPTAMSKFGLRMLKDAGFKPKFLPHGVNTEVFKPLQQEKPDWAKGKFVVGCIAANKEWFDRKGLIPTVKAFAKFHKKHEASVFYFHGEETRSENGVDLEWIAQEHGVKLHKTDRWVRWAYCSDEELATLYNAFDVFMLLTKGEGFCIPLIEAQACGKPVIVTDYTAPSDLVGAGWKIPITHKVPTLLRGYWGEPDIDKAVDALEEAYQMWKNKEDMIQKAREFALDYDYKIITKKYLIPILKEIEDERTNMRTRVQRVQSKKRKRRRSDTRLRKAARPYGKS
jgi:glycosyltransferase involved in cell wall biosynthesis